MIARAWLTVCAKEIRESLRDRRTLGSALLFGPLMMPAVLVIMLSVIGGRVAADLEKTLVLPVVGAGHAPNLVAWLRQQGVDVQPGPADPAQAVLNKQAEVVLVITPEYGEDWRAGRPAAVELHFDRTRDRAQTAVRRARGLLEAYSATLGALRLTARGIDPDVARALAIEDRDASSVSPMLAFLVA
ncbi:MAG: ABC transporter permease, partial [Gammaproteobacteria bacterium]